MASAGTLLSELDARGGSSSQDNDLVEKILMDMNASSSGGGNQVQMPARGMAAPPPPLPASSPGVPMGTSFPQASDPLTAQAHVIGKEHPTPGDFAAAMYGMNRAPEAALYGGGGPRPRQASQEDYGYDEPKKNLYARVWDEVKTPLLISLIFFTLSLPAINMLVSAYIPSLVQATGSLTMIGLLGKALVAGALFWVLQRVVAPLLKA